MSVSNLVAFKEKNVSEELILEIQKDVTHTVDYFLPDAAEPVSKYLVPLSYKLDPNRGLIYEDAKGPKVLSSYIILIKRIIEDVDKIDPPSIEVAIYSTHTKSWIDVDQEFRISELTNGLAWKIDHIHISLSDKDRKHIAEFVHQMFRANIGRIQVVPLVRQVGFNRELGKVLPAEDIDVKIKVGRGTTAEDFVKAIMSERKNSSETECRSLIEELKQFPKFLICTAGVLASPLMTWNPQEEGMGIDLFSGSTTGKTAVQSISVNLVWGPIGTQMKWSATSASTWEIVQFGNGVPFLFDDTHQIDYKDLDIPHLIIEGKGRNKMVETSHAGFKLWATMKSKTHYSVYLFNGEVPLVPKVAQGSTGIKGRVIQLVGQPFSNEGNTFINRPLIERVQTVERWVSTSKAKGGYFIGPWIKHINSLNRVDFVEGINAIGDRLGRGLELNSMQGRLITKAAILSWTLAEFGRRFGIELDIAAMEAELMVAITQTGDVARNSEMMLTKIKEYITELIKINDDAIVAGVSKRGEYLTYNNLAIYGVKGSYLAISNTLLKEIFADNGKNESMKHAVNLMKSDGFLEIAEGKPAIDQMKKRKIEGIEGFNANDRFSVIKIKWEHISDWFDTEE